MEKNVKCEMKQKVEAKKEVELHQEIQMKITLGSSCEEKNYQKNNWNGKDG